MRQTESLKQYAGIYIVILLLSLVAVVFRRDYFQITTVYMMLRQAAALGILSMGQLFVVTAGGTDLSVDSTMKISMVVFMLFHNNLGGQWLLIGIVAALLLGLVLGSINGFIITKFNVTPFLATMFTGAVFSGVRRMLTGVSPLGSVPPQIARFIKGEAVGEIPYAAYILFVVTIITFILLNKTVFGRKLMLVGSNPTAADLSGIRVLRMRFFTYVISSGVAVLAAVVVAGYTGYVDQETLATGMGFESLIAVVLGGNFLGGGKPTALGTLGGALATTFILNIVVLFGLEIQHQYVFKGLILILVVLVTSFANNRKFASTRFGIIGIKPIANKTKEGEGL